MAKRVLFHLGILGLVGVVAGPAQAQTCVGDCDASNTVTISELILLVNIAGGRGTVSECSTIDVNGNGSADIDELVEARRFVDERLRHATDEDLHTDPDGHPHQRSNQHADADGQPHDTDGRTLRERHAGNRRKGCDDGNTLGGDGCAANCTHEDARKADLKNTSISYVQSASLQIKLSLTGQQVLTTGQKRDDTVFDKDGNVLFNPGDIPVVIKVTGNKDDDVFFNPVRVQGLVVRLRPADPGARLFGPAHCSQTTSTKCSFDTDCPGDEVCVGISAIGKIACGDDRAERHRLSLEPGSQHHPRRSEQRLFLLPPFDASAAERSRAQRSFTFPSGVVSDACVEGSGATCSQARYSHHGVCNSPRNLALFTMPDTDHGPGSQLVSNNTAIGLLADNGDCDRPTRRTPTAAVVWTTGPTAPPDEEDADLGNAENLPTTSGFASSALFDANDAPGTQPGRTIDQTDHEGCTGDTDCDTGAQCRRTCAINGFVCTSDSTCGAGDTCQPDRKCDFICAGNRRCRTRRWGRSSTATPSWRTRRAASRERAWP